MPLQPEHISNFLDEDEDMKFKTELLELLRQRIDRLCFKECEIDRIQCTLTPLCTRRKFLKLRIKNNLTLEDLPKFCYSVHKGVIEREFRNKTVVYKPFDSYLFLVDFLDVFFHGDYRRLNKLISFKKWKETFDILDDRINNRNENFKYLFTGDYLIFKFDERIHIIYINEKYVLCNATRENIHSLELLAGICQMYSSLYFPEGKFNLNPSKLVEIGIKIPYDVLSSVKEDPSIPIDSKADKYFWNLFGEDIDVLTQYCEEVHLQMDSNQNLKIILLISNQPKNYFGKENRQPLRFRELRLILNIITRIYNDFFILWLD